MVYDQAKHPFRVRAGRAAVLASRSCVHSLGAQDITQGSPRRDLTMSRSAASPASAGRPRKSPLRLATVGDPSCSPGWRPNTTIPTRTPRIWAVAAALLRDETDTQAAPPVRPDQAPPSDPGLISLTVPRPFKINFFSLVNGPWLLHQPPLF